MFSSLKDTITSLATPAGVGAIHIIRVSGKDSFTIADKVFSGSEKISTAKSHSILYGKIIDESGETIDDVLVAVFVGNHSYTGENSVEISSHGNPLIVQKIINQLILMNARLAEPGEFTKRAFLNGKMDLIQSEAVADLIHSRTEASFRGARNQLDGLLSSKIKSLREELINCSSLIELELDFSEEDVQFVSLENVRVNIVKLIAELDELISSYSYGKVLKDGVNVAIVGEPNVGKSSLMNYFLKESRAIVSEIPGTTRDIISEDLSIEGILFKINDTAGIRISNNLVEREGVRRSREAVKNADVVLFVNDIINGYSEDLYNQIITLTSIEKIITVFNKIDLSPKEKHNGLEVSALTGEGIKKLFNEIKNKAIGLNSYTEKTAIVSNIRHLTFLKKAKEQLLGSVNSIELKLSGEFVASDIRSAEHCLGEIIGEISSDDILNNIFSNFCIGK